MGEIGFIRLKRDHIIGRLSVILSFFSLLTTMRPGDDIKVGDFVRYRSFPTTKILNRLTSLGNNGGRW